MDKAKISINGGEWVECDKTALGFTVTQTGGVVNGASIRMQVFGCQVFSYTWHVPELLPDNWVSLICDDEDA